MHVFVHEVYIRNQEKNEKKPIGHHTRFETGQYKEDHVPKIMYCAMTEDKQQMSIKCVTPHKKNIKKSTRDSTSESCSVRHVSLRTTPDFLASGRLRSASHTQAKAV
jgi:hypothetical protein